MGRWGDGERVSRFDLIAPTVVEFTYLHLLTTCTYLQPWPKGHATRTTFNLGQKATLREQPLTLAKRPRYANNL
ncbi:hypothetical protein [Moorena sp. SIO4G3]|uniref:hypothetical protein n=1 Tax=Moorena sp. SIO4G3 TaxID=2607821 RepID=UPI00142B2892|nr:hypothetical protein [Moorena sp. SIO4G3]NEO78364.1 hypothetical protein [Moorena sp. SIO4G3]